MSYTENMDLFKYLKINQKIDSIYVTHPKPAHKKWFGGVVTWFDYFPLFFKHLERGMLCTHMTFKKILSTTPGVLIEGGGGGWPQALLIFDIVKVNFERTAPLPPIQYYSSIFLSKHLRIGNVVLFKSDIDIYVHQVDTYTYVNYVSVTCPTFFNGRIYRTYKKIEFEIMTERFINEDNN